VERRITGRPLCRNQYKSWFGSGPQSLYQYFGRTSGTPLFRP